MVQGEALTEQWEDIAANYRDSQSRQEDSHDIN